MTRLLHAMVAILWLAAPDAAAGEGGIERPSPGIVGWDRATSSACIGDPATPLCAVLTQHACRKWGDAALCRAVGYRGPVGGGFAGYGMLWMVVWDEIGRSVLAADNIPPWAEKETADQRRWLEGDLVLDTRVLLCRPTDACYAESRKDPARTLGEGCPLTDCGWEDKTTTYILRPSGDLWQVIDVHVPGLVEGRHWNRK